MVLYTLNHNDFHITLKTIQLWGCLNYSNGKLCCDEENSLYKLNIVTYSTINYIIQLAKIEHLFKQKIVMFKKCS